MRRLSGHFVVVAMTMMAPLAGLFEDRTAIPTRSFGGCKPQSFGGCEPRSFGGCKPQSFGGCKPRSAFAE